MNRFSQVLAIALLASGLACGSEVSGAGAAGGRTDRAAGSGAGGHGGEAQGAGAGTGGISPIATEALSGGSPTSGGAVAGPGSTSAESTGGSVDRSGGASSSGMPVGGMGGTSDQAGTSGSSNGAGTSGRADAGGTTGKAGSSAPRGGNTGTSSGTNATSATPVLGCTSCHGDSASNDPAPPSDTEGNMETTFPGVGAHNQHLHASIWHRQGKCADCHTKPATAPHANGKVDFTWGVPSNANSAKPNFDTATLTCSGAYCHGTTLPGASAAKTTPVWNQVNQTWNACASACHATPPAASTGHPVSASCEKCHSKVIASFEGTSAQTTWKDASLHINGTVEVDTLTCTSCHGSGTNPAPPKDTQGGTASSEAGVGAHAQHLGTSAWHRQGQCADCHKTPTSTSHANNTVDFAWGTPSNAGGATPTFSGTDLTCGGTYCHGARMTDKSTSVGHSPVWNKVDGTHDACGKACHANPPSSGSHTASSTACQTCHGDVIASFNGASSTWKNASLHINGKVEASAQACDSCHGNPPNRGTHTRRDHKVACTNCHPDPNGATHRNGKTDQSCGSNRAGCHDGDD
jgi:predicted CxxxxCH...CXXCH cytochrome family protein